MWLLSCDDESLGGKRVWLRPGSAHLLGRTSNKQSDNGERVRYIDHSSVSRKHLVLKVDDVKPGDSTRIHTRSAITVTDASKKGSIIDGEPLRGVSKTLENRSEHSIKLGQCPINFRLVWQPVVLSFMTAGKSAKAKGTALKEEKEKLEAADIKLTTDYLMNETTHVINRKRNTAECLQALVQARWTVTESFAAALADACRRKGGKAMDDSGMSALEEDFDANWPREVEYIIPTSGEPGSRPNEYLKPDPERAEVFFKYAFIFLTQLQLDRLMPVITAGGGKAHLFVFVPGQTTVDDVANFAKELAGKKHAAAFTLSQEPSPGGIVVVRSPDKGEGRSEKFVTALSLALDQRTIEQGELLDAILTKDASVLRRPLLRDPSQSINEHQMRDTSVQTSSIPGLPAASSDTAQSLRESHVVQVPDSNPPETQRTSRSAQDEGADQKQQEERPAAVPSYRRRNRRAITQRYDPFNDFDPSEAIRASPEPEDQHSSQAVGIPPNQGDEPSQRGSGRQTNTRKRPAPEVLEKEVEETDEQMLDRLMPGQAALKRRRTEALQNSEKTHSSSILDPDKLSATAKAEKTDISKKGKGKKAVESQADIRAKLKAKREAEDEARLKDEESMQDIKDFDPEKDKIMHVVEVFDVPLRPVQRPQGTETMTNDRNQSWDPAWNGRQNYKRFRSNNKTLPNQRAPGLENQRNIISLEPVARKGKGLGDEYWLEEGRDGPRKNRASRGQQSQSQTQSQHRQSGPALATANGTVALDPDEEDDARAFRRRLHRSRLEDEEQAESDVMFDKGGPSQSMRSDAASTLRKAAGKRPAAVAGLGSAAPSAKKPRQAAVQSRTQRQTIELSDDDDDPMAFRRKRR